MPELGPQTYQNGRRTGATRRRRSIPRRAPRAVKRDRRAGERGAASCPPASWKRSPARSAIANNKGLFAYSRADGVGAHDDRAHRRRHRLRLGRRDAHDWSQHRPAALGARATQKARASVNPVAIEPGRYTVVLRADGGRQSRAVHRGLAQRARAPTKALVLLEAGRRNKIGKKVVDERVTIIVRSVRSRVAGLAVQLVTAADAARRVDRERRREESRLRSLLGAEAGTRADGAGRFDSHVAAARHRWRT